MDSDEQIETIVETVVAILKEADLEEATEQKVRTMAACRLGIDPSELGYKWIVRRCVESYLLSLDEEEDKVEELHQGLKQNQGPFLHFLTNQTKPNTLKEEEDKVEQQERPNQDGSRVICKLSGKRSVAVHNFRGKTLVSFRDYYQKNGKLLPTARGISLSADQWSTFRKSVPDIQATITKMESRIRSKDAGKQMDTELSNSAAAPAPAQGLIPMEMNEIETEQIEANTSNAETASAPHGVASMEVKQIESDRSDSVTTASTKGIIPVETKQRESSISRSVTASVAQELIHEETTQNVSNAETTQTEADISNFATTAAPKQVVPNVPKQIETDISDVVSAFGPRGLMPIKTTRLNGKNYYCWAHQMEIFLKHLKVAYVLTDGRPNIPNIPKASFEEFAQAKAEVQKWVDDDNICCHSILNCLSDHLFDQYSKQAKSAKDLWEELKSAYDEDFGTKRSQVNKYIQFQMVDGISVLEQAQELSRIANSIVASGMWIDEDFHASAIISKLPPSWKEYRAKLMHEESITLVMLMHRLRVEEESRDHAKKEEFARMGESSTDNQRRPKKRDLKGLAMHLEMEKGNKVITCFRCGKKGHISRYCPHRMVYVWEKSNEGNEVVPVAVEANTREVIEE